PEHRELGFGRDGTGFRRHERLPTMDVVITTTAIVLSRLGDASLLVIPLALEDRRGPVPLLEHYDASQLVRERQRSEAPTMGRSIEHLGRQAVGAADDQDDALRSVAPGVDPSRQIFAGPGTALAVERDDDRSVRDRVEQPVAFVDEPVGD